MERFKRVEIQDKVVKVLAEDIGEKGLDAGSRIGLVANDYCLDYCVVGLSSKFPDLNFVGGVSKNGNGVIVSYNIDEYARRFED